MTMTMPLIGIMGQKRSGKDTAASTLVREFGYVRYAFADPMKEAALALDPLLRIEHDERSLVPVDYVRLSAVVSDLGWERAKTIREVRRTLQRLGTEMGRDTFGASFWVDLTMSRVADAEAPVVITDVRFPNEAEAIRKDRGLILRVERPGLPDADGHASEHAWRDVTPDVILHNTGTVEDLDASVRLMMQNPALIEA